MRPEGFIPDEKGVLTLQVDRVEVMGRDVSIVATHKNALTNPCRIIVSSDYKFKESENKFRIKDHKMFLFDAETEERIYEE